MHPLVYDGSRLAGLAAVAGGAWGTWGWAAAALISGFVLIVLTELGARR